MRRLFDFGLFLYFTTGVVASRVDLRKGWAEAQPRPAPPPPTCDPGKIKLLSGLCSYTPAPTKRPTTALEHKLTGVEEQYQRVAEDEEESESSLLTIVTAFFGVAFALLVIVMLFAVLYRRVKTGGKSLEYEQKYVNKLCEQEGYKLLPPEYSKKQSPRPISDLKFV